MGKGDCDNVDDEVGDVMALVADEDAAAELEEMELLEVELGVIVLMMVLAAAVWTIVLAAAV